MSEWWTAKRWGTQLTQISKGSQFCKHSRRKALWEFSVLSLKWQHNFWSGFYHTFLNFIGHSPSGLFRATVNKQVTIEISITWLRIPTGRRQTSWLFTSIAEKLNSRLPRTTTDAAKICPKMNSRSLYTFGCYIQDKVNFVLPKMNTCLSSKLSEKKDVLWDEAHEASCLSSGISLLYHD